MENDMPVEGGDGAEFQDTGDSGQTDAPVFIDTGDADQGSEQTEVND